MSKDERDPETGFTPGQIKRTWKRYNQLVKEGKIMPKHRPPRYDDIYFEGLKQLDEAAENDS